MARPADEARQLVDQRTMQLAKLHWALRAQAGRAELALAWLAGATAPRAAPAAGEDAPPDSAAGLALAEPPHSEDPVVEAQEAAPQSVEPEDDLTARRLRVIVSESRVVSLEVEGRIPPLAHGVERQYRLAS